MVSLWDIIVGFLMELRLECGGPMLVVLCIQILTWMNVWVILVLVCLGRSWLYLLVCDRIAALLVCSVMGNSCHGRSQICLLAFTHVVESLVCSLTHGNGLSDSRCLYLYAWVGRALFAHLPIASLLCLFALWHKLLSWSVVGLFACDGLCRWVTCLLSCVIDAGIVC